MVLQWSLVASQQQISMPDLMDDMLDNNAPRRLLRSSSVALGEAHPNLAASSMSSLMGRCSSCPCSYLALACDQQQPRTRTVCWGQNSTSASFCARQLGRLQVKVSTVPEIDVIVSSWINGDANEICLTDELWSHRRHSLPRFIFRGQPHTRRIFPIQNRLMMTMSMTQSVKRPP